MLFHFWSILRVPKGVRTLLTGQIDILESKVADLMAQISEVELYDAGRVVWTANGAQSQDEWLMTARAAQIAMQEQVIELRDAL